METKDYLKQIAEELHTSVMATVDSEGHPVTCAIDIMDWDESGLYFLTAKGKSLYERLSADGHLAITLMKGSETMNTLAISFKGSAREIGPDRLHELFEKNPYMYEIYPAENSRRALTVFHIYEGTGEWFNMGNGAIEHHEFSLGHAVIHEEGFCISDLCTGCGACAAVCPRDAIRKSGSPCTGARSTGDPSVGSPSAGDNSAYIIDQAHCIRCGNCFNICPVNAVQKKA